MADYTVFSDKIVIKPIGTQDEATKALAKIIAIKEGYLAQNNMRGTIVALGPDVKERIAVGDTILFRAYSEDCTEDGDYVITPHRLLLKYTQPGQRTAR